MKKELSIELLCEEAKVFSELESKYYSTEIFGVTDGKAVGTYFEHKFQKYLHEKYNYKEGNSAKGIDFPELNVEMKVTSIEQPQSSCPFKSPKQKIYGLGYSLLVFVYDKKDNLDSQSGILNILHTIFVEKERTADYQTTTGLLKILDNDGNKDDILAFIEERMLPVEEIMANEIADEILINKPQIGYLTISNALQWRLQYSRIIKKAGGIEGLIRIK